MLELKDVKMESNSIDKNFNFMIKRLTSKLDEGQNFKHHYSAIKMDMLFSDRKL